MIIPDEIKKESPREKRKLDNPHETPSKKQKIEE